MISPQGGQGAPLVPAFHQVLFRDPQIHRVIVNIGGISNLTSLPPNGEVTGFDCGPGNIMMDAWCLRHTGKTYDENGAWAASGRVIPELLEKLLALQFFSLPPPKSTGREIFNLAWLESCLSGNEKPADVQATLLQLTISGNCRVGTYIIFRMQQKFICVVAERVMECWLPRLRSALPGRKVELTDRLGVDADWLEAFAFAWLAKQAILGIPANHSCGNRRKGPQTARCDLPGLSLDPAVALTC